jgi:hypothetical protein
MSQSTFFLIFSCISSLLTRFFVLVNQFFLFPWLKFSFHLIGPLHGIPYGLKDIIVVPGYKTTWGSGSFKDQVHNIEAWVYKR